MKMKRITTVIDNLTFRPYLSPRNILERKQLEYQRLSTTQPHSQRSTQGFWKSIHVNKKCHTTE